MERRIKTAKFIAKLLDSQFEVGGVKFGFDPILNVIPYFGDIAGLLLSLYFVNAAIKLQVSRRDMVVILINIIIDFVVGFPPLLGIIFDVMFKSNLRNAEILEKYTHGKFVEGEIVE